ncbi:MAG: peptide-methionine (S)-S-oxide reductase MsrA [Gemmatimonadaceae bacterium]
MTRNIIRTAGALAVALGAVTLLATRGGASAATMLPAPAFDDALATTKGGSMAVFSGGCFWGVQAVFQHVKGVTSAVSGYAGGEVSTANYDRVSDGNTGHAESVRVTFDTSEVTYGQLLKIFFSVAHDPTQLNFQGPDHGTQYRSEIWYTTPQQKTIAESYIAQLTKSKAFSAPIVTKLEPLSNFFPAEAYHQDYFTQHPNQPYIVYNDAPKVAALKKMMPELWRDPPVLVGMAK